MGYHVDLHDDDDTEAVVEEDDHGYASFLALILLLKHKIQITKQNYVKMNVWPTEKPKLNILA